MKVDPDAVLRALENIVQRSPAPDTELVFSRNTGGLTRVSKNFIHQNMVRNTRRLNVRVVRDKKTGSASTDSLDSESVNNALEQADHSARVQPPDVHFKALPARDETLIDSKSLDPSAASMRPARRADIVRQIVTHLKKKGIETYAALSTGTHELAILNTCGIRSYQISSVAEMNIVAKKGHLTAYAYRIGNTVDDIEPGEIIDELIPKLQSRAKKLALEPGKYTVVLEPYAVADLIGMLGYMGFGALAYMEKRSFMSRRKGRKVAHENVSLRDEGTSPGTLRRIFDFEGVKKEKVYLIKDGYARDVVFDSRTAGIKRGAHNTGHALPAPNTIGPLPLNMIMSPGRRTLGSLIKNVKHGIYVTRFHYTNVVDPLETIITGMTRDGTFLIKNGTLDKPVIDLRFTQNVLEALKNVTAIGKETRLGESVLGSVACPPLLIEDFHFTGSSQ